MSRGRIIVVGAGIAGLVAAHRLKNKGFDVLVLEAAAVVGGRMISDHVDGCCIDAGAQFLSSEYPVISGLIKELGLSDDFVTIQPRAGIVRGGKIRKFRYDRPLFLLTSGALKPREWFRLGAKNLQLRRQNQHKPLNDYSAWVEYDTETALSWSTACFGKNITEYIMDAMTEAFYFQSLDEMSKALLLAVNTFALRGARTMTLKGGIGRLPRALAQHLDIMTDMPVSNININKNSVSLSVRDETMTADKVVLALPAPAAAKIYRDPVREEKALLKTPYSSTLNISLVLSEDFSKDNPDPVYGVWVPRPERRHVAAFTFESMKSADRAPTGEIINVMLTGRAGRKYINADDDSILTEVRSEMNSYLPGVADCVVSARVYRWISAEPMSPVGRCSNILQYRRSVTGQTRVVLAGDYLSMPFTEGAAESGIWAAEAVSYN